MVKPIGRTPATKPGCCPACGEKIPADRTVIATRSGSVLCATHDSIIVPEAIIATGCYADIRKEIH